MIEQIKERIEQIKRGVVPNGYKKTSIGIVPSDWVRMKLGEISMKSQEKNVQYKYSLVLSNSARSGVLPQSEQFKKEIASNDNIDGYYVIHKNDFVYNPRISATAP